MCRKVLYGQESLNLELYKPKLGINTFDRILIPMAKNYLVFR